MQVKFSSKGQTCDLGFEVKGKLLLNFGNHVNFKDFYTKFCVFSQMKDTKNIRRDFYSVTWVMPQGWVKEKFKHGHVAYQVDGDDEQNKMQVTSSF